MSSFDALAEDTSETVKCCGMQHTQKAILLVMNTIAGFFHLALGIYIVNRYCIFRGFK